jgi:hypothetical protein
VYEASPTGDAFILTANLITGRDEDLQIFIKVHIQYMSIYIIYATLIICFKTSLHACPPQRMTVGVICVLKSPRLDINNHEFYQESWHIQILTSPGPSFCGEDAVCSFSSCVLGAA